MRSKREARVERDADDRYVAKAQASGANLWMIKAVVGARATSWVVHAYTGRSALVTASAQER